MQMTSVSPTVSLIKLAKQQIRILARSIVPEGSYEGWHERVLVDLNPKIRKHVRRFRRLDPFW